MKKWILVLSGTITGIIIGFGAAVRIALGMYDEKNYLIRKNEKIIQVLNQWLKMRQKGKVINDFLIENHYHSIAVYGAGRLGQRLIDELQDTEVEVKYVIDRNEQNIKLDLPVYSMENLPLASVDTVIVTIVTDTESVVDKLGERIHCPVWELSDILYIL